MSAEPRSHVHERLRTTEAVLAAMHDSLSSVQRLLAEARAEIASIRQEVDSPTGEERRALRREVDQLREALASRGVIERAKGILMHTYAISEAQSFDLLNDMSKRRQRKVREVAAEVVGATPAPGTAHTSNGQAQDTGLPPPSGERTPALATNGAAR